MTTIEAIVVKKFGPPDVMKLEKVPVPKCGDKEVLVRIHAAGVNAVDPFVSSGAYPVLPQLPYTPGKDAAGVVETVGSMVRKVKVGDRVFCTLLQSNGSYAEYGVFPEEYCWPLPDRLTFAQGASVGIPYFTAYRGLFQIAQPKPLDTILVHGASGAVGLALLQLAKASGMTKLYGTAGSESGMKVVQENGAGSVFNHRSVGYTEELMKATNGEGFDVILEMLGNVNLAKDLELVKPYGTVVLIGARGTATIDPRILMKKNASVQGMALPTPTKKWNWDDMTRGVIKGLENGTLTPIVAKEYPLAKAATANKDIVENAGAKGNLILTI